MPQLRFKRTPEEEAARQARKKRKERKRKEPNFSSRRDSDINKNSRPKWNSSDDDRDQSESSSAPFHHQGPSSKVTEIFTQADIDEIHFREKMFDALGDDERLDGLEARFNDFTHVPDRWKPTVNSADEFLRLDPQFMDNEEYAEWIRLGMYRKTHAAEYAEEQRRKALKAERRAEEKAKKLETRRLEKLAHEDKERKRRVKELHRRQDARQLYELRWAELNSRLPKGNASKKIRFLDIPWPVLIVHGQEPAPIFPLEHLTKEAVEDFLFVKSTATTLSDSLRKERKDTLRENLLRFHPDKFEGRFMEFIRETDKDMVRKAVGQVAQSLNALMVDNRMP